MRHQHASPALLIALLIAVASGCGEGEAELCFAPQGVPTYVGRPAPTGSNLGSPIGCGAAAQPPPAPAGSLCDDACIEVAECNLTDFDTCVESCELNPGCADGFRCLRDTPCEQQIDECADLLEGCAG